MSTSESDTVIGRWSQSIATSKGSTSHELSFGANLRSYIGEEHISDLAWECTISSLKNVPKKPCEVQLCRYWGYTDSVTDV